MLNSIMRVGRAVEAWPAANFCLSSLPSSLHDASRWKSSSAGAYSVVLTQVGLWYGSQATNGAAMTPVRCPRMRINTR